MTKTELHLDISACVVDPLRSAADLEKRACWPGRDAGFIHILKSVSGKTSLEPQIA